jgi:acetyl esterase
MATTTSRPILEPGVQTFVDQLQKAGGPPISSLTPQNARQVLRDAQKGRLLKAPVEVEDRLIPGGPTGDVSVRIYRPRESTDVLPAVIYLHGGGWVLGDQDTHARLMQDLTTLTKVAFVFVNYTPSPEARFPVAIEQGYAVAKWVAEKGTEAKLDSLRLAIAGDSVGGQLVAAITLLAKQRGGPKFHRQLMFYPVTDAACDTPSYQQFANGPWLTKDSMRWFWQNYLSNDADANNVLASPLRASVDQLRGLPPALIITDENDVLRDEGEAYGRKLEQAGVHAVTTRYLATIHDFVMLNALADTDTTQEAINHGAQWLRDGFFVH